MSILFRGIRTTDQPLTGGSEAIQWDDVSINVGGAYSSGTFTCPSDGLYLIVLGMEMNNPLESVYPRLRINGTAIKNGQRTHLNRYTYGTWYEVLSMNDEIELGVLVSGTLQASPTPTAQILHFPDGEMVYQGEQLSNIGITPNVTNLTFPDNPIDPYSSMISGVYTIPETATYGISVSILSSSQNIPDLYKNGSLFRHGMQNNYSSGGLSFNGTAHWVQKLESGDTVSIRSSGSATTISGQSRSSWISIARLKSC